MGFKRAWEVKEERSLVASTTTAMRETPGTTPIFEFKGLSVCRRCQFDDDDDSDATGSNWGRICRRFCLSVRRELTHRRGGVSGFFLPSPLYKVRFFLETYLRKKERTRTCKRERDIRRFFIFQYFFFYFFLSFFCAYPALVTTFVQTTHIFMFARNGLYTNYVYGFSLFLRESI